MAKDEMVPFPAIRAGIECAIAVIRAEHEDHDENITHIGHGTANLSPLHFIRGSLRAHYSGSANVLNDLTAHIAVENDVRFSRFELR